MEAGFPIEDLDFIIQMLDFRKLQNQNLLLTGGTGFIGRWFIESFLHANKELSLNASLTIITRNVKKFLDAYPKYKSVQSLKYWETDVRNLGEIPMKFSFVIHAAADSESRSKPFQAIETIETITSGTKNMLSLAYEMEAEKFLFLSSGAVYGKISEPVSETYAGAPDLRSNASYGESKRMAELLCNIYAENSKLNVSIARIFSLVGPGLPLNLNFAIGNFIRDFISKREIVIRGDGNPIRSYIYASELMVWLWKILLESRSGETYNVGSDESISMGDLARKISFDLASVKILNETKSETRDVYVPVITKAKKDLGLEIQISLEKSIQKTIEFYRN
ncbi:NAD-dependent epimerase/dehydratase family protein [Leptospira ognonensis]|uniref:NAD-dependent epimerase/dehydratase family protein n=1 Tax=Leptospira ognonensis TaxID=2484945 RepID=A0A4R9JW34_9LEPT|nr:NAD-dependent epimerase/dehydratase family protein [Leptospira ognonensis]TGL57200.1 NAD-dependent epimerase/dehydratase family protein [Leptospira ognonensis]